MKRILCCLLGLVCLSFTASPQEAVAPDTTVRFGDFEIVGGNDYTLDTAAGSGRPVLELSGGYPAVKLTAPIERQGESMQVVGNIRVDSLAGVAEVVVRTWTGSGGDPSDLIGEYRYTVGTADPGRYRPFRVEVPICPQAQRCDVLCWIRGHGACRVDSLGLAFDGKPPAQAPLRSAEKVRYRAAQDKRFDTGSGFHMNGVPTAAQAENLVLLGRVWGFLKYYHPAVRRGDYDWDNELFAVLPTVYDASPTERNRILCDWVRGLGPLEPGPQQPAAHCVGWIGDTAALGADLSDILTRVAVARRTPFCYYAYPVFGIGSIGDRHEKSYPDAAFTDDGVKLLAVYRLWNRVEYFFPYKAIADAWHGTLEKAVPAVLAANDRDGFEDAMGIVVSATDDTHSNMAYRPADPARQAAQAEQYMKTMYGAPFICEKYLDGMFLVTFAFGGAPEDLRTGDAILAIDGQPVDEFIVNKRWNSGVSHFGTLARDMTFRAGFFDRPDSVTYTVDRGGDTLSLRVGLRGIRQILSEGREAGARERPAVMYAGRPLGSHEDLGDSILYVDAGRIMGSEFRELAGYRRMIVDLRHNLADGELVRYFSELVPHTDTVALNIVPDLLSPGKFDTIAGDIIGSGRPAAGRDIVVLVDEGTQSHGEYNAMVLQASPEVRTIGSRSAGADGNIVMLQMPYEYQLMLGGIGLLYPDGTPCQRVGVRLDEVVYQTLDRFRAGSDAVIERAVALLQGAS